MTVTSLKKTGEDYAKQASNINRQLALGGIAIIWIFKVTDEVDVPQGLYLPLALLTISLLIDLVHYILGYIAQLRLYIIKKEVEPSVLTKIANNWRGVVTIFFFGKIGIMLLAYILIILFILKQ